MIGSVANSSLADVHRTSTPVAERASGVQDDARAGMSESKADRKTREMYARLTPADWAVVSASVGSHCGPDETGYIDPFQPQLAVSLAFDRDLGRLKGPVTADYLKADLIPGQPQEYVDQLLNAIDFLQQRPGRGTQGSSVSARRVSFLA